MEILHHYSREDLIGPSSWKFSDLGLVQFENGYDPELLGRIRDQAIALKDRLASPSCLSTTYIRAPHLHIPELADFVFDLTRISQLEEFAQTRLEVYPLNIASCFIHFMSHEDGSLAWHSDAVPSLEIINLALDDLEGGQMEIYCGSEDEGRSLLESADALPVDALREIEPRIGYSVYGQFTRTLHRTKPITKGNRIALLIAHRSVEKPYVDDNSLWFLGADNPDFEWAGEFVRDERERKLPAYLRDKAAGLL